jgi:prolipoprotein diacylglyceryltransferase
VPLHAQALCVAAGILLALAVTDHLYRKAGGGRGVVADVAAWAIPAGMVPAAIGILLARSHPGVLQALRTADLVAGFPAAVACGAVGAWLGCGRMRGVAARVAGTVAAGRPSAETAARMPTGSGGKAGSHEVPARTAGTVAIRMQGHGARIKLAPIASAAAPALLLGHALVMVGEWFTQRGYGRPSSLWWAVEIAPAHRAPGFENFATFQPVFAYQALWDVAVGIGLIYVAHRFKLADGQVSALACAAYAAGGFMLFWLVIGRSPAVLGLPAISLGDAVLLIAAGTCLVRMRRGRVASSQLAGKVSLERSRPLL